MIIAGLARVAGQHPPPDLELCTQPTGTVDPLSSFRKGQQILSLGERTPDLGDLCAFQVMVESPIDWH